MILISFIVQVFTAVHLISSLIPKAFHFPKPKYRQQVHSLPELQLVALIIVAIKLYHPLDDVTRFVTSETDLGFLAIDWKVWQEAQEKRKKTIPPSKSAFPPGGESRLKESDVFDLTGAQIDSYLDWYEKTFEHPQSSEFASDDLSRKILALFPTSRVRSSVTKSESADDAARTSEIARDNAIRAVTGALKVRGVVSDEQAEQIKRPISRVGDGYRIYWKQEELEGTTRVFFEMIAELAGIDLDMLVAAVRKIEIKLEGLKDSNRSAGEAGEEKADAEAPKPEGEVMDIDAPGANEKPA